VSDCRLATNKLSAVSRTKLGISLLAHADLGVGARGPCPPNEFRERREIPSGAFRVQENLSAAGALPRTPLGESSAPAGSVDRRRAAFLNPTPVSQLTGGIIRHQSWLPSCHRYRKSSISCGQNNAVFAKFFNKSQLLLINFVCFFMRYHITYFQCLCYLALPLCIGLVSVHLIRCVL